MTIAVDIGRKATKTNKQIYTRNTVKYSFLLSCIDRMLNYGLKSQQMLLHANLQSEMVLTIFTIFEG